jgi:hypothetical protein
MKVSTNRENRVFLLQKDFSNAESGYVCNRLAGRALCVEARSRRIDTHLFRRQDIPRMNAEVSVYS